MERAHRDRLADMRDGSPRHTYGDMMIRWAEEHLPTLKPSSAARYRVSGKALNRHFRKMRLDQINRGALSDFVSTRRRDGVKDPTIRRDLACLSSALQCAVNWGWLEYNVVKSFDKRKIRESRPRVRWLRPEEYRAVLECAGPNRLAIVILVETGIRLGELLSLEHRNMMLERREIYLNKTKTGSARMVPLSDAAIDALRKLPQYMTSEYVIFNDHGQPVAVNAMSKRLSKIFAKAGVEDFSAHDLRHTMASWFLQRGGRIERLQEILGHDRLEQTRKYAHLATEDLHEEMRKVGTNTAQGES